MSPFLLLKLDAPLMAFGGIAIDNYGVEMPFPAVSLITGLLANALGYRREQFDALQCLQDRLRLCIRMDQEGEAMQDFQTAKLGKDDAGWTTRGIPEGRAGGPATYDNKHLRYRDYHADRVVMVALLLTDAQQSPTLTELLAALQQPARPLYIGRKCCLPAAPIAIGIVHAENLASALATVPLEHTRKRADGTEANAQVRQFEALAPDEPMRIGEHRVSGLRQWRKQLHGGEQRWLESRVTAAVAS